MSVRAAPAELDFVTAAVGRGRLAAVPRRGSSDGAGLRPAAQVPRVTRIVPESVRNANASAVVADLNPVLRGWGAYFRNGNSGR
ncbi:group II intron maturase-specific domain-containing protein [Streptomyces bluensis]|uniref:group II intron maturase-specific domain-containing protein n=1 Tax=Streptomyces bluensis TaxID=33897 RepID=UPI003333892A